MTKNAIFSRFQFESRLSATSQRTSTRPFKVIGEKGTPSTTLHTHDSFNHNDSFNHHRFRTCLRFEAIRGSTGINA